MLGLVIAQKYRIDSLLGAGGMGAVYRATQLAINRPVAVKVLRNIPGVDEQQLIERFRREALATSKLRHPNTVSVIDFGQAPGGLLYMVLELLEGATLSRVIRASAPLPPQRVAAIGKQIAKSLAEAHELGIVHRDLKPDNIFLCDYHGEPDFVKVMDFGIARLLAEDGKGLKEMTRTGIMMGTPKYMPPEQAMAKKVGPPADLYALGVILFEMLSGAPPFSGDSGMALALAHVNDPVPKLVLRGCPEPLAAAWRALIGVLLAKSPERRPQTAAEVGGWLHQLETDAERLIGSKDRSDVIHLPSPASLIYEGPSGRATRHALRAMRRAESGRRRVVVWLLAIVFMGLGGLFAYLLVKPPRAPKLPPPLTTLVSPPDAR